MVWTDENRARYDRRGQRYPSDITDAEWSILQPLLPVAQGCGRPRVHVLREIMNGIRYVQRYGIPWDALPKDLPPHSICYDYWRLLTDGGHMEQINHHLVMADREKAGREASPTLVILDAQSVKCDAPQGPRGFDAAKKIRGRKGSSPAQPPEPSRGWTTPSARRFGASSIRARSRLSTVWCAGV